MFETESTSAFCVYIYTQTRTNRHINPPTDIYIFTARSLSADYQTRIFCTGREKNVFFLLSASLSNFAALWHRRLFLEGGVYINITSKYAKSRIIVKQNKQQSTKLA